MRRDMCKVLHNEGIAWSGSRCVCTMQASGNTMSSASICAMCPGFFSSQRRVRIVGADQPQHIGIASVRIPLILCEEPVVIARHEYGRAEAIGDEALAQYFEALVDFVDHDVMCPAHLGH